MNNIKWYIDKKWLTLRKVGGEFQLFIRLFKRCFFMRYSHPITFYSTQSRRFWHNSVKGMHIVNCYYFAFSFHYSHFTDLIPFWGLFRMLLPYFFVVSLHDCDSGGRVCERHKDWAFNYWHFKKVASRWDGAGDGETWHHADTLKKVIQWFSLPPYNRV